jgi:RNA polymerase sigma-70 factor (ECF subfamily)
MLAHQMAEFPIDHGSERTAHADVFATTHWSVVLAAQEADNPRAQAALEELCRTYWYPLYAYVRRRGHAPEEAEDLTQEFFARLLGKNLLSGVKRERGKFRAYLLNAFKWFLANEWHREQAQKRGGAREIISIDEAAERRYAELSVEASADLLYEREWAWTVLHRVTSRLAEEYAKDGKGEVFAALRGYLPRADGALPYDQLSVALHMNAAAVRMAVHRLRRRYGEFLRAEISATVSDPGLIDEEIRCLIDAASG